MSDLTDFFPAASGGGGGGYIPGLIGVEYLALSGGGAGGRQSGTYGGGGAGGGTLVYQYVYLNLDVTTPVLVGAGGAVAGLSDQVDGGSTVLGEGLLLHVQTILGGGGGTYNTSLIQNFGTCAGGRGSIDSNTAGAQTGNGFDGRGRIIGLLSEESVKASLKNINDTTIPYSNSNTAGFSGPGGGGLGGNAANGAYNNGTIGGIGLNPNTITDRFLTQAEFISEGIGEVTSSVAYIGGGGSGYRATGRANPPGGCGAANTSALAYTGGGGGAGPTGGNGGSGFAMLRIATSQSVTTTGTVSTYTKGNDTVYVWKGTGSITLNS
tara:strand:+ start:452 stop:1420 length:969 start_codon:yes stop_codon:yes gene_type:complete